MRRTAALALLTFLLAPIPGPSLPVSNAELRAPGPSTAPLTEHPSRDAAVPQEDRAAPSPPFDPVRLEADLRFLASDELGGRLPGTPGSDVAARYLAEQFRAAGLEPLEATGGFLQPVPMRTIRPPEVARLATASDAASTPEERGEDAEPAEETPSPELLILAGGPVDAEAELVFVGHGAAAADYGGVDARGRIAVARVGTPDGGPFSGPGGLSDKRRLAEEHGAVALIELYEGPMPWERVASFLGDERMEPATGSREAALPHGWIRHADGVWEERARASDVARVRSGGMRIEEIVSYNVAGRIRGRDPELREEIVLATAHYDHLGRRDRAAADGDTIYNGARDNGMGVVALLAAARALSARPPRRSVVLLAVTAEEQGLLGSRHYVDHPLVPLERTVFVLNTDGAGYSDTDSVTLLGAGRTTADPLIAAAARAAGLELTAGPEDLFRRSDNVVFADAGIPAPTLSPGFETLEDPRIATYYHRPGDEVDEAFDVRYLARYCRAFSGALRRIADADAAPTWTGETPDPDEEPG